MKRLVARSLAIVQQIEGKPALLIHKLQGDYIRRQHEELASATSLTREQHVKQISRVWLPSWTVRNLPGLRISSRQCNGDFNENEA
jgi:hypothetical protein